jgi:integrase
MSAQKSKFTNAKHQKQWESTIQGYAYPLIGSMLVSDIAMRDVLGVLEQKIKDPQTKKFRTFWEAKTETASRVQGRIKKIMDYAIVNEYRTTINPATWVGYLETQLPAPNKIKNVEHQPAVPYSQVGDFMIALRKHSNISAKALEFLIMTSVRSGSVRKAVWSEINMDDGIWTIPAKNTKMKKEHRVPLPKQAIALLKSLDKNANNPRIFPSVTGKDLSDSAISKFMKEMRDRGEFKSDGVPHGFRSTFRDWAAEKTKYPDDIRKVASGHKAGNAVQEVYQRTDLLEKRRKLMTDWLNFIDKPSPKAP